MFIYKIRNSEGKFSTGGAKPNFTHLGKHWNLNGLFLHLKQAYYRQVRYPEHRPWPYDGCEIVKFELVESKVLDWPDMSDWNTKHV